MAKHSTSEALHNALDACLFVSLGGKAGAKAFVHDWFHGQGFVCDMTPAEAFDRLIGTLDSIAAHTDPARAETVSYHVQARMAKRDFERIRDFMDTVGDAFGELPTGRHAKPDIDMAWQGLKGALRDWPWKIGEVLEPVFAQGDSKLLFQDFCTYMMTEEPRDVMQSYRERGQGGDLTAPAIVSSPRHGMMAELYGQTTGYRAMQPMTPSRWPHIRWIPPQHHKMLTECARITGAESFNGIFKTRTVVITWSYPMSELALAACQFLHRNEGFPVLRETHTIRRERKITAEYSLEQIRLLNSLADALATGTKPPSADFTGWSNWLMRTQVKMLRSLAQPSVTESWQARVANEPAAATPSNPPRTL